MATGKKRLSVAEQRRRGLTKSHEEFWAKHQFTDEEIAQADKELERLLREDADQSTGRPDDGHAAGTSNGAARPRRRTTQPTGRR